LRISVEVCWYECISDQMRVLVKEDRKDERSSEREENHEEAQSADKDWLHARGAVGGGQDKAR